MSSDTPLTVTPTCPSCQLVGAYARTPAVEITAMSSSSGHVTSSMTPPFDCAWPLSYRLPTVNDPLSPVVSDTHEPNAAQVGLHTPAVGWATEFNFIVHTILSTQ